MSSDEIDELAQFRARRNRDRRAPDQGVDEAPRSAEQADALARARESWALSQLGREAHPRHDRTEVDSDASGPDD